MEPDMRREIKVWDIATRLFHWSLVVCFVTAYISGDEGNLLHIYSSYIILGLLAFRLIWGGIGPRYVRFSNFVPGLKATLIYLRSILAGRPIYYLGHNPLGGWIIVLLLISLALTSWTGLDLYAKHGKGPLASANSSQMQVARDKPPVQDTDVDQERENEAGKKWLEELHEALAGFSLLLVIVHIAGVFIAGLLHRENLVKAMWTGYKTPPEDFKTD